jgi:hypothetical protein
MKKEARCIKEGFFIGTEILNYSNSAADQFLGRSKD